MESSFAARIRNVRTVLENGTKHFNVSHPSVDPEFSILQEYVPPPADGASGVRFLVVAGDKYDLLALADRCVELWEQFVDRLVEVDGDPGI